MNSLKTRVIAYLGSLRFPVLLIVALVLFIVNVFVPDAIPFVDEILLALIAAILSRVKRRPSSSPGASTPADGRER